VKRRNLSLIIFGTVVTVFVFVLFIVQGWSFLRWNEGKPLTTLEPRGQYSRSIQGLVNPVFGIAALVFFLVLGLVLYIGFRFRDKGDLETEDEIPPQLHGKTVAEIGWTVAPALVLLVVGLLTVVTLGELNAAPAPDALKVKVEGQQWWWRFVYDTDDDGTFGSPGDVVTANELVIPVGREIALTETSNDVIHSFWIPALNGKKDAVPGMTTDWKLSADAPGVYQGTCTEFCGLSHSNMRMLVRAVSKDDFTTWETNQKAPGRNPTTDIERAGKAVFEQQLCSNCHLVKGVNEAKITGDQGVATQLVPGVAPDLTHFASRGTFAGSMFNSRYPNPAGGNQFDQAPFGQTCRYRATGVSGTKRAGLGGGTVDEGSLPVCPEPDDPDAFDIPWTSGPGNPDNPPNSPALAAWLRDPTKMKPMAALPEENPHAGGRRRGMPNLNLSADQINQLVAYLNSLT
jgi:cytochrome c oxidase subunit II